MKDDRQLFGSIGFCELTPFCPKKRREGRFPLGSYPGTENPEIFAEIYAVKELFHLSTYERNQRSKKIHPPDHTRESKEYNRKLHSCPYFY